MLETLRTRLNSPADFSRTKQFLEDNDIPISPDVSVLSTAGSSPLEKKVKSLQPTIPSSVSTEYDPTAWHPQAISLSSLERTWKDTPVGAKPSENRPFLFRSLSCANFRRRRSIVCLRCGTATVDSYVLRKANGVQIRVCKLCYPSFRLNYMSQLPAFEFESVNDTKPEALQYMVPRSAAPEVKTSIAAGMTARDKRSPVKRRDGAGGEVNGSVWLSDIKSIPDTRGRVVPPRTVVTSTCTICTEVLPRDDFRSPTADCTHKSTFCRACLRRAISSDLEEKGWDKITCPDTNCRITLGDADIRRLASDEVYERYSLLSTLAALSTMDDFRRCLRAGCNSGQIHCNGEDGPIFRCHDCGHKACAIHNIEWHEGETCKEYDYRMDIKLKRQEEEASEATVNATAKRCPQCSSPIEKNEGCDHMTCRKSGCGFEFCWLCLANYDAIRKIGNSKHERTCRYYME